MQERREAAWRRHATSFLGYAGLLTAAASVTHGAPGLAAFRPVRCTLFPRLAGAGASGHVALTFDDGPDPRWTPQVLDLLGQRGVHATFFLLGERATAFPGLAAQIAAAGHEVGVHGWEHRYLTARGPRAGWRDIARARAGIAEITGQVPAYFRPPYGVLTGSALLAVRHLGLQPVLWTCWGREWAPDATSASVIGSLGSQLRGGATILLHDSDAAAPVGAAKAAFGALPWLLDECGLRGLAVGTVAEHGLARW